ncbi:Metal-dependent hydrolases of the beta-lactamase superfamily II [Candidatus Syntrophocurvum alkaliphilum]|uniref:Metal-dependent hydrolases of the beta-lactamase superfamily II n=1 Tax=Candidatus Syntrophocurvum alkaliphilum TaxID=2293317 RepID=A0A6I6DF60_9FIRM|nr:MBL fold metallo-hydrolase [Candidatus Syntrophocurvum alkaliphilum]QGT99284.1 Metal-dependent hydrolases of the beta-lactamase superfamily II [Candidatus Syntrophocurvum alkaliphilum]
MQVTVSILVENTAPMPSVIGEYGFAALVTVNNENYLIDTGNGDAIFKNASAMGENLNEVSNLIISHGHFDHTGAVSSLLKMGGIKKIYAHSAVFSKRYIVTEDDKKDIGSCFSLEEVQTNNAEMIFTDNFTQIAPNIYLTGAVPRNNDYEDVGSFAGGSFKTEHNGNLVDDTLPDDIALIIDHPDGLIIISGCAHSGIVNIINYAIEKTGRKKILSFIGGTHLMTASDERINKTIEFLKTCNFSQIIPCHCTGFYSAAKLYSALGNKIIKGEAGMTFRY